MLKGKRTRAQCLWDILKRDVYINKTWKTGVSDQPGDDYEDDFIPEEEGKQEMGLEGAAMTTESREVGAGSVPGVAGKMT